MAEGGSADVRWVATASTAEDSTGSYATLSAQAAFQLRVNGSRVTPADNARLSARFGPGTPAAGIDVYGTPFDIYVEIDADIPDSIMQSFLGVNDVRGGRQTGYEAINSRRFRYRITPNADTELVTVDVSPRPGSARRCAR